MKTFFVILGSVILFIGVLWVWAFVPVKAILKNMMPAKSVPEAYRNFPDITQSAGPQFKVFEMQGSMGNDLVLNDASGNYLVETFRSFYSDTEKDKTYLYRIDAMGNISGIFNLPDDMYLHSGYKCDLLPDGEYQTYFPESYLVSPNGYSTWLHTSDTSVVMPPAIDETLSPEQFRPLYTEADAVFLFKNTAILLNKGKWNTVRLGFNAWQYPNREEFEEKREQNATILPDSTLALLERPGFDEFPGKQGPIELCYFERAEYAGNAGLSGIGNPTGRMSEHWNGYGYFRLSFGDRDFCFKYPGREYNKGNFFFALTIYLSDKFAIIKDESHTYLVQNIL
ncbi:MAG: hypothetical protein LBV74_14170 [Tannerella sp.]|jgi:hypothetical protein|nr:hypothetical protein [Tannerella sp.]